MATVRTKKKIAPRPTSKAKTAYGLLSEVKQLILTEPKRYCQYDVLNFYEGYDETDNIPACGTVGCVAGWVYALKRSAARTHMYNESPLDFAQRRLGLTYGQADELFEGDAAAGAGQTAIHARSGAKHIARFQKKYAAQLKAKAV